MIKNFGDTANGKVSGSIPNGNLRVPEWKNVDVVGNLINMYYANEKNNRENEALQLGKAKQDLAEQMLAYNSAQNEIAREDAIAAEKRGHQFEIDRQLQELKYKQGIEDARTKKINEIGKVLNSYRGDLSARRWIETNPAMLNQLSGKYDLIDIYHTANIIDGFYTSNGNSTNIVNGDNGVVGNGNANVYLPYGSTNFKDI